MGVGVNISIIEVGNLCLQRAKEIMESEMISATAPIGETERATEIVKKLVECAALLDTVSFRWADQNRSGAAAILARASGQRATKTSNLSGVSTRDLLKELQLRPGVETTTAEPYENVQILVNGPAVVLKITD